ncbi:MAG: FliH/SctL family protein [Bacillota bacterium]
MSSRVIKARKLYSGRPRLVSTAGSSVKVVVRDGAGGAIETSTMSQVHTEPAVVGAPVTVPTAAESGSTEPAPMTDAEAQARLVEDAAARAEAIVANARDEAAIIEREAHEKGLAAGREEGLRLAQEESHGVIAEAGQVLEDAKAERQEIIAEARPEILRLALAVAHKIIREAAEDDSEMTFRAALDAVKKVRDEEELTIRANPRDAVELEERRQELRAAARGLKKLTITEDPTIEPGGCVVDGPRGSVDARIERQLTRAEKALRDVMNSEK